MRIRVVMGVMVSNGGNLDFTPQNCYRKRCKIRDKNGNSRVGGKQFKINWVMGIMGSRFILMDSQELGKH